MEETSCSICHHPECPHTPEEIKKYEEDQAWEENDWEDPSVEDMLASSYRDDMNNGLYHGTFNPDGHGSPDNTKEEDKP